MAAEKKGNHLHILFRYGVVTILILLFSGAIGYKLFSTTVIDAPHWNEKARKQLEKVDTILPERGDILSDKGDILATNLRYYTVRVDFRCENFKQHQYQMALDQLADSMGKYFPVRTRDQWRKRLEEPLKSDPKKRPRAWPLITNISYLDLQRIKTFPFFSIGNRNKTGMTVESVMRRSNPYGAMARRSVGGVGQTAECKEIHGIYGLEKALDSLLYGVPGLAKKIALTKDIVNWTDVEPVPSGVSAVPRPDSTVVKARMVWHNSAEPFFAEPIPFVRQPEKGSCTPFYGHNHQPAVTWCENGDLLAIWFTAEAENGREMAVLQSRLHPGASEWTPARLFFKVPGRNMTGSSLLTDRAGNLWHFNGVEAAGDWQNLALALRVSPDNGATWSAPRLIEPRHTRRHQAIAGPIVLRDGTMVQLCDAGPGSHDGTSIHLSADGGQTWNDPWDGAPLPRFGRDTTGTTIAGIHAGIVELADGTLMAMGRGNSIKNADGRRRMPMSTSSDRGKTWHYAASEFPPIDGGQRLVLMRLREGPILLVAFTDHPDRTPEVERGMTFTRADGSTFTGRGMYAALSYDDGRTWPVRKLLTDGRTRRLSGGAWTGEFTMDETHAEPLGYLAATQTPDGTIHLLSSGLHYRFNLPWLERKE